MMRIVAWCGLALSAHVSYAQSKGISGRWIGSFDTVHADGSVDQGGASFSFSQQGGAVSGTAGDSPAKQSPIGAGTIKDGILTFEMTVGGQTRLLFNLTLDGDRLRGTATGLTVETGSTVSVDVARTDESWQTKAPTTHVKDRLSDSIVKLDGKLFDAYNTCDLSTMGSLVTDDLEFYHDKTGLAVGRKVFLDSIQNNICGKTQRALVPGTLEVYRLAGYGAVEIGVHRFFHPGHEEIGVGEAKFVHIWRFKDGAWQISRVISYDHGAAKQ